MKHECDFVTFERNKIHAAIQVCYHLNEDNLDREIKGLIEATAFFKIKEGLILTYMSTKLKIEKLLFNLFGNG